MSGLALHPATMEHVDILLAWRNDVETRAASLSAAEVTPAEHRAWFERMRHDQRLYVADLDGQFIGTGRLDYLTYGATGARQMKFTPAAEVSLTIAPAFRGQGLGHGLVAALVAKAAELGREIVTAKVKADNARSLVLFIKAAFIPIVIQSRLVQFERRLT